jgi:hypothetical protein
VLLKDVGLLSDVLTVFLRAVFALQQVEQLLKVVRHRVLRLLEKRGALPAQGPEDAQHAYQAHSPQQRLRWDGGGRPTGRDWSGCAATERAARWRWSG